jgi:hypothetical protein
VSELLNEVEILKSKFYEPPVDETSGSTENSAQGNIEVAKILSQFNDKVCNSYNVLIHRHQMGSLVTTPREDQSKSLITCKFSLKNCLLSGWTTNWV